MLRITQSQNGASARAYFTEGLSREGYYGREDVGYWQGRGAELLGLEGEVTREQFEALVGNRHPETGRRLTPRDKERTPGYDWTFSVPKSVSVLYVLTGDKRIREAFQAAVIETMREAEAETLTRVRQGGQDGERVTGNMVWAAYNHYTSRPVGGVPDPHLHMHAYVFNLTHDEKESAWKAVQFRELKRDAPYWEAAFDARLGKRLADLGFPVERTGKGWELAGVPASAREKFSRRTAEVEAEARRRGISSDKEKDGLGAKTRRNKKEATVPADQLRENWLGRLSPEERRAVAAVAAGRHGPKPEPVPAAKAIDHALAHSLERASVVGEKRLLAEALKRGVGSVTVEEVRQELGRRPDVLIRDYRGQRVVTTREVLAEEQGLVGFAREGRGTCKPLGSSTATRGQDLTPAQENAVRQVLDSADRVTIFRGKAGVGKTRSLQAVAAGAREAGREVHVFAPGTEAARGVLRREGFDQAETVARLLADKQLQAGVRPGDVLVVDEAGQLGTRDMRRVFEVAERAKARVLLVGDTAQHASVPRGDALRILETQAGLRTAELRHVLRQRGEYRKAVESFGRGETLEGLERLDRMGAVEQIEGNERHQALAGDYLRDVASGRSALVVSPTHAEGERVSRLIREGLRAQGRLAGDDVPVSQYRNLHLTAAEKRDTVHYRPGDVVQFHKGGGGFRQGERVEVAEVRSGEVLVRRPGRRQPVALPLERARHFDVYERREVSLAAGDTIRITQNGGTLDRKHRLNNGGTYTVAGFTSEGHVCLDNGWTIDKDYGHLAHGYVATSHASQGRTVDHVYIAQSSLSWGASSQQQLYVSASRGREGVTIYTDDKEGLKAAVARSAERLSASEVVGREAPSSRPSWGERLQQYMRRRALERTYRAGQQPGEGRKARTPDRPRAPVRQQTGGREAGR